MEIASLKTGKLLAFGASRVFLALKRDFPFRACPVLKGFSLSGSHTKYIAQALKSPENIKLSEDGETILP